MKYSPIAKFLLFILLIIVCGIIGSFASVIPILLNGASYEDLSNGISGLQKDLPAHLLRLQIFLNQVFMFLLPAVLFSIIFFKKNIFQKLDLNQAIGLKILFLSILLLIAAYPLVNVAHLINSYIPLPQSMKNVETDVAALLRKILESNSSLGFVVNIGLVALTPAICEELVFRGIIQKLLYKIVNSPHAAIWIAAVIFSTIHFQFEGFLARIILGATLGYAYYWTKNLWVPILIHFCNNLIPVLVFQYSGEDITQSPSNISPWLFLVAPICVAAILFIRHQMLKSSYEQV